MVLVRCSVTFLAPSKPQTPKICGGTVTFAGKEASTGVAGGFSGAIVEHDSVSGTSTGGLVEAWGGDVLTLGGGYITPSTKGPGAFLDFSGINLDFVAAGFSVGVASGKGWTGLYYEGHIGRAAVGGGAYVTTVPCKVGG
jgi:hypothetical protein